MLFTEVQLCWWMEGRWVHPTILPGEGNWWPPLFRKPSQKSEKSPLLWPRVLSDLWSQSVCAWAISTSSATILCFVSGTQLEFKTPNLKRLSKVQTSSPPPEERLPVLCPELFCPRKAVAQLGRCLESMVKHIENCDQVICPLCMPLSPVVEWSFSGTCCITCPWRGNISWSKCTPEGGMIPPSAT